MTSRRSACASRAPPTLREREMPRRRGWREAIDAERAAMVKRVADEQRDDEEQAHDLDHALGVVACGSMTLTTVPEAPHRSRSTRETARAGHDRLDGTDLMAVHEARLTKRENQTGAVVGDGQRGDLFARSAPVRHWEYAMLVVACVDDGAYRQIRKAPMSASTSAPAVQFATGPRRSVIEENGRSFQLRRSRGGADWSFARRRAVMNYRRSALWGSTTRGSSRAVH